MRKIVIGTRGSSLALCQAQIVQTWLEDRFPDHSFTVKKIKAQADREPKLPLSAMVGEGVFVKELESALQARSIDLAVHSMKDLPLDLPEALRLAAILPREEPRDALIARDGMKLSELKQDAIVGTGSPRRRSQLLKQRGDLKIEEIRGNVDTRLRKLEEGKYDAIVLAACGLVRLGLEERITELLEFEVMLPEPGQGALAVEVRGDDAELIELVAGLEDSRSRACIEAERAFLAALGGGCRVPIAAYAGYEEGTIDLEGAVFSPDGSGCVRGSLSGDMTEPVSLGERLAVQLSERGARDLLEAEKSKE